MSTIVVEENKKGGMKKKTRKKSTKKIRLTVTDYKKILTFYKLSIPKTYKKIKKKAEKIISKKFCSCIKKVQEKFKKEGIAIGICTKSVVNGKGYKRGKFTCKKRRTIKLYKGGRKKGTKKNQSGGVDPPNTSKKIKDKMEELTQEEEIEGEEEEVDFLHPQEGLMQFLENFNNRRENMNRQQQRVQIDIWDEIRNQRQEEEQENPGQYRVGSNVRVTPAYQGAGLDADSIYRVLDSQDISRRRGENEILYRLQSLDNENIILLRLEDNLVEIQEGDNAHQQDFYGGKKKSKYNKRMGKKRLKKRTRKKRGGGIIKFLKDMFKEPETSSQLAIRSGRQVRGVIDARNRTDEIVGIIADQVKEIYSNDSPELFKEIMSKPYLRKFVLDFLFLPTTAVELDIGNSMKIQKSMRYLKDLTNIQKSSRLFDDIPLEETNNNTGKLIAKARKDKNLIRLVLGIQKKILYQKLIREWLYFGQTVTFRPFEWREKFPRMDTLRTEDVNYILNQRDNSDHDDDKTFKNDRYLRLLFNIMRKTFLMAYEERSWEYEHRTHIGELRTQASQPSWWYNGAWTKRKSKLNQQKWIGTKDKYTWVIREFYQRHYDRRRNANGEVEEERVEPDDYIDRPRYARNFNYVLNHIRTTRTQPYHHRPMNPQARLAYINYFRKDGLNDRGWTPKKKLDPIFAFKVLIQPGFLNQWERIKNIEKILVKEATLRPEQQYELDPRPPEQRKKDPISKEEEESYRHLLARQLDDEMNQETKDERIILNKILILSLHHLLKLYLPDIGLILPMMKDIPNLNINNQMHYGKFSMPVLFYESLRSLDKNSDGQPLLEKYLMDGIEDITDFTKIIELLCETGLIDWNAKVKIGHKGSKDKPEKTFSNIIEYWEQGVSILKQAISTIRRPKKKDGDLLKNINKKVFGNESYTIPLTKKIGGGRRYEIVSLIPNEQPTVNTPYYRLLDEVTTMMETAKRMSPDNVEIQRDDSDGNVESKTRMRNLNKDDDDGKIAPPKGGKRTRKLRRKKKTRRKRKRKRKGTKKKRR